MQYEYLKTQAELIDFCGELAGAASIAFDTEFVSEDRYRPDLCLIQVAVGGRLTVIDTHNVDDATPFWQALTQPGHQSITHAGREELRFCLRATNQRPNDLFDVQIVAALIGLEYPAAYSTLANKLLGESLRKGETRTNWRHRPLSHRQIEYALQDVLYLESLRDVLQERLDKLGRRDWLAIEMSDWQAQVEAAEAREGWGRVSGISGLSPRQLAIVRELWRWRDAEAEQRDQPVRRILRDDLIVEMARRQTADLKHIRAVRGLERRDLRRHHATLGKCIELALSLPSSDLPKRPARTQTPQLNLLSQFLTTALASICRGAELAPSIVGTAQDVRELIAYRLNIDGAGDNEAPSLAKGWRAEVVGHHIEELLAGNLSIRITDPLSDHPLTFEANERP